MADIERGDGGRFAAKGDSLRVFRGIRLTDATWNLLGDRADELDISKADYLEGLFSGEIDWENDNSDSDENESTLEELIELFKKALTISRKGNITKQLIAIFEECLEVTGNELEEDD
jgi:hypothetical protein